MMLTDCMSWLLLYIPQIVPGLAMNGARNASAMPSSYRGL